MVANEQFWLSERSRNHFGMGWGRSGNGGTEMVFAGKIDYRSSCEGIRKMVWYLEKFMGPEEGAV